MVLRNPASRTRLPGEASREHPSLHFLGRLPQFVEFAQATILTWPPPDTAYVLSEQQVGGAGREAGTGGSPAPRQAGAGIGVPGARSRLCWPGRRLETPALWPRLPTRMPACLPTSPTAPQVLFYTLDTLPILLVFACYILCHPGYLLPPGGPAAASAPSGAICAADVIGAADVEAGAKAAREGGREREQWPAEGKGSPKEDQEEFKLVAVDLHS